MKNLLYLDHCLPEAEKEEEEEEEDDDDDDDDDLGVFCLKIIDGRYDVSHPYPISTIVSSSSSSSLWRLHSLTTDRFCTTFGAELCSVLKVWD